MKPNSRIDEITCDENRLYHIKIKAPPVDGKANKYLVEILSSHFGVAKSRIKILKGETSSFKIIEIEN